MLSLNCSEISMYIKIRTEELTECAWYIIGNNSKKHKQ